MDLVESVFTNNTNVEFQEVISYKLIMKAVSQPMTTQEHQGLQEAYTVDNKKRVQDTQRGCSQRI